MNQKYGERSVFGLGPTTHHVSSTFCRCKPSAVTLLLFTALVVIPRMGIAQTTAPASVQPVTATDSRALATLGKAMGLLGGTAVYAQIHDLTERAVCTRDSGSETAAKHVRWIISGNYARFDTDENPNSALMTGPSGDYRAVNGSLKAVEGRVSYSMQPFFNPGILLSRALASSSYEITSVVAIQGDPSHVRIRDLAKTDYPEIASQDWYFDPTSGLPLRVKYELPTTSNTHRTVSIALDFATFENYQGAIIPTVLHETTSGGPQSTCKVSSFLRNTSPSDSLFTTPNGGGQ